MLVIRKELAVTIDRYDKSILKALQKDGRLSNRDLADQVGLSAAPCWRRVKRLEDHGFIRNYIARLDPEKIGLKSIAFAEVALDNHHPDTLESFSRVIAGCSEILECHSVSGKCDYLLKIITMDESLLKSIGVEGRKNIIQKFNVEKMCFSTYSEYKRIIN